jgi:hypothetical protein
MEDVDQIVTAILDHESDVAVATCKEVWPRIAQSGRIRPDCEVVTLVGRDKWFSSGGEWSVKERLDGWHTPSPVTIEEGSLDSLHDATYDIVIDATGESWLLSRSREDAILIPWRDEDAFQRVVLPRGAEVRTTVRKFVHATRRAVVGGKSADRHVPDEHYLPAVRSILRGRSA